MKKTIITLLLFFYWLAPNFGQTDTTRLHQMFTLNFLPFGAGILGEFPLTRKSTIRAEIGGVFTFSPSELSFTNVNLGVGFSPYGSLSYRYFHHLVKNTENRKYFYNSGNFIFAQVLHYASPLYKNEYFIFIHPLGKYLNYIY